MPEILALAGPSGSGKTTFARELLKLLPEARMIPSHTTRGPRPTDLPGEYEYIPREDFDYYVSSSLFLWHVTRDNISYGTMRDEVFSFCDIAGEPAIGIMILVPSKIRELHVIVHGQYRDEVPIVPIFLVPPEEAILRERLRARGETQESIEGRMRLEADWLEEARSSNVPFHCIEGGRTPDEIPGVVEKIKSKLGA